eukprot:6182965-Prymnesium_polylepis.1
MGAGHASTVAQHSAERSAQLLRWVSQEAQLVRTQCAAQQKRLDELLQARPRPSLLWRAPPYYGMPLPNMARPSLIWRDPP